MSSLSKLPEHLAIVMDGNGRWAKHQGLPRFAGHKAGMTAARKIVKSCGELGIQVLTLFAFGEDNWRRPEKEVNQLMELMVKALDNESSSLHQNNVRLVVIGDRTQFKPALIKRIDHVEQLTANNTDLTLVIAISYSGRWDITQAARALAKSVQQNELSAAEINQDSLAKHLALAAFGDPDLLIRTSGEQRLSNFLLWHLAYTELYFTETLWPDFNDEKLHDALSFFASRERRYGYTTEQLEQNDNA